MGWFSGWFGGSSTSSSNNDPLRDLDPSLRDFLEKESPVKYQTSAPPPPPPPAENAPNVTSKSAQDSDNTSDPSKPSVPPESLFQDGRYAHLWSTYTPRAELEGAMKSDQEKLMDVLEGYKARKAMIGKAALENCTLEQEAVNDCYKKGTWGDTMTMCRTENQSFTRCYTMQARFLKALGYLSAYDRPPEVDEQIQMHADTLYHTMLARERAIAHAKENDLPEPKFPPLISPSMPAPNVPSSSSASGSPISASAQAVLDSAQPISYSEAKSQFLSSLRPEIRPKLEKEWDKKGLNDEERMLEARALAMEAEAGIETADVVGGMISAQRAKRKERREQGQAGWGDTVSGWFGW
ncbi:MAG: hypothetical protein Q9183_006735 [Haloplaca sp. 2 TL-2023]